MPKAIIGVVGQINGWNDNLVFSDQYYFLDNYSKALYNYGAIPIGILMNDLSVIKEALDLCDGFLITGGTKIKKYHMNIIDYAIKNNKPLLGICCGMQALAMYSTALEEDKTLDKITSNNHDMHVEDDTKESIKHAVILKKDSLIHEIFNTEYLEVNSFHMFCVKNIGKNFKITAHSEDGVIEAIEHTDKNKFIIGVQWHPELLSSMHPLFKKFIEEASKR